MNHLGTVLLDSTGARLTLVSIVEAEVANPGERAARRSAVREACWAAVDAGLVPDFDHALLAYTTGQIVVPA